MPATGVHSFFAIDVFDILPKELKKNINPNKIKMFGQSMDCLMFYNLFSIFPGKKIREFDNYFHDNKSQEFFINLINYIKDNNLKNDIEIMSFLSGLICHYILDSTMHPYIIYKTGEFNKKNKYTYKYNNVHAFMETFLDNDMIKRRSKNNNPYNFKFNKYCFDISPFSNDLNNTINYVFEKTFNIKNMGKIYYKSLKQMKNAILLFRMDKYGVKKFVYKLVDSFTPNSVFRFEAISYHYPLDDRHNYLNNNHKLWRNPCIYNLTSTESFIDLYLKSLKQAKVTICATYDYLNNKNIDLNLIFDNRSYLTGLNCNEKKELKYFEF